MHASQAPANPAPPASQAELFATLNPGWHRHRSGLLCDPFTLVVGSALEPQYSHSLLIVHAPLLLTRGLFAVRTGWTVRGIAVLATRNTYGLTLVQHSLSVDRLAACEVDEALRVALDILKGVRAERESKRDALG